MASDNEQLTPTEVSTSGNSGEAQNLAVKISPHKDDVTVLTAPVQYTRGQTIRIKSTGKTGDASTTTYRDGIRTVIQQSLEGGRLLISPYMMLRVMASVGYDYVPEKGPTGMVDALIAVASDPIFDLEALTVSAWGVPEITFKPRDVPLVVALKKECPDIFERIHIVSPTSYAIMTDLDFARKKTAEARLTKIEASILKTKSTMSLAERVFALVEHAQHVTTGALQGHLAETEEERIDADGKFRKRIAEVLKLLHFTPEIVVLGGKKTKVFRSPIIKEQPESNRELLPEAPVMQEFMTEDTVSEAETAVIAEPEADESVVDVPVDRKELPSDWKPKVQVFLQSSFSRSYMSLEELILRALERIPQEIGVNGRGQVSKYMLSLGLSSTSLDDRKVFHPEENVPSEEELRAHFAQLDREMMEILDIKVSDAPPWMNDSQKVNLSYLEHATLLLCEDGTHTRAGLFPGHPNVDWQRKAMSVFLSYGLVSVHGSAFFTTYSGTKPAIEQALDREFLLNMFWSREVADHSSSLDEPEPENESPWLEEDGLADPEPEERDQSSGEDEDEVSVLELTNMVKDMYEALRNHAEEIRKLKKRLKKIDGGDQS